MAYYVGEGLSRAERIKRAKEIKWNNFKEYKRNTYNTERKFESIMAKTPLNKPIFLQGEIKWGQTK